MDKPGSQTLQSYEFSTPEQFEDEPKDDPATGKCYPSSSEKSELQNSLHCRKEQKRRLQIRTSCQRLCELLPFVNGPLDTATTLELTVNYISYLKETLPPDILSKVIKAVEMNSSSVWKNIQNSQKKRKTIRLKKNTLQRTKPAAKKSNEDHVPRSTQKNFCKKMNQPSITITSTQTMDQTLPQADSLTMAHASPILLDKSTVPRGQMLPVYQDQFLSASFQFVEHNWINSATAFMNPTSCAFTSAEISHTFLPQMGPSPSSSHTLWDAASSQVDPVAFPAGNFGQAYIPPEQIEVSYTDSPQVSTPDSVSVEDFTNQLLIPPSKHQSELASSDDLTLANRTQPVSEALYDSRLFQDGDLCSSSPLTDSQCDVVSPFWLDLLLDSSGNFCFPDPNLVDFVLSPKTWSN